MKTDNVIVDKSKAFALRIINLYKYLCEEKHECILSKQLIRSGTSIGANIMEAIRGQSNADFTAKINIALKEASETEYWLELLHKSDYLTNEQFDSIHSTSKRKNTENRSFPCSAVKRQMWIFPFRER